MYQVKIDDDFLYIPGDKNYVIESPVLELTLGGSGSFTFTCPRTNPRYGDILNRKSMISVTRDGKEIFYGEVRNQEKDFLGNKKISCVGVLGYLADSIQPQKEYHDKTPRQLLTAFIEEHNSKVEDRKKFTVGVITVTDPNDSLYRYSNFETTLECIRTKLVDRLGGYLTVRHEGGRLYLDWLNIEDIGVASTQTISFGMNLLDYTENLSADNIATALIPLGAEIEDEESGNDTLKHYVDITSVNNDKNYIVSDEAYRQFGWVCAVEHWDDVNVPSNLLRKGREWLTSNQFENVTLNLTAVDLSLMSDSYESIQLGDKIRCIAPPYGMDRLFPVLKLTIPLSNPADTKIELGETKAKGYIEQISQSYKILAEETENTRKVTNERIKDAVSSLSAQMGVAQGGYKITEYDSQGRWLRDLYMDTMDKNTATKVLQVNMNGIGGSKNGYAGPYNVGMTLDGQILGERIVAGSVTAEKLSVSYTSQVEKKISDSQTAAVNSANTSTDNKLKNYYTMSEVNTKLSATDGKIVASVETINKELAQKSGNYYGNYVPTDSNEPAKDWNTTDKKKLHIGDLFYNTSTGYAYRYAMTGQCLKIVFSSDSRTEAVNFDWVQIFYEMDGKTYALPKLGGTMGNTVVYVPATSFKLYWRTDGSVHDYYGYRITSITKESNNQEIVGELATLPTDVKTNRSSSGSTYPQSTHSPYEDNMRELWTYTSSETLSTSRNGTWVRVVDQDIAAAKSKAEDAISRITVAEGSISSMVTRGEFGTLMQQNYYSFLYGFNNGSSYIQMSTYGITFYSGSLSEYYKKCNIDESGIHFYRDNYYVGKVGTNYYSGNYSHKGLVFDLDAEGKYMAFAQKPYTGSGSYTTMLCFSRANSIFYEYGMHLGCDLYCHNYRIVNPQWETGFGCNATMYFVQVMSVDNYGNITRWGNNARMTFRNGILMDLYYYS